MNWDYTSGKERKKRKENKKEEKTDDFFIRQLTSVLKNLSKSVIYLLFSYQTRFKCYFITYNIYIITTAPSITFDCLLTIYTRGRHTLTISMFYLCEYWSARSQYSQAPVLVENA